MLTWLKRFLALPKAPATMKELSLRVDELEDAVEYWAGAHRKLRGTVTGGKRSDPPAQDSPGHVEVTDPAQIPLPLRRKSLRGF